jgi:hypothetical protein
MRSTAAAFLVVLATLLTPLGVAAVWTSSTVDSTEAYVETVASLADDPALRKELATRVSAAAVGALQQHSTVGVPDTLSGMARVAATEVVESKEFPALWRSANAEVHREFLSLMHEEGERRTAGGWVYVDLSPVLDRVLDRLEREGVDVDAVPDVELEVPVVREEKLAELRGEYQLVDGLGLWIPLLWAVLVAGAVAAAHGWRGRLRTLGFAALGLALGAALVRLAVDPVTRFAADQVDAEQRDLVELVADVVLGSLASFTVVVTAAAAGIGLLLVISSMWPRRGEPVA